MATTTATQIQQLYVGLLGRAADQGGLNWWADQVTTGGKTLEDIRASFVTSTEYTTTYGAAATRADLVTSIYQNLFERTPSADEVKYWAETDTRPADQLVAAFIEFAGAADQAVINNKTFVAQTYTDTVGNTNFSKVAAAEVIANVDGTAASVTLALDTIGAGTLPGQVPALALINALEVAVKAQTTFEAANTAAADALVAKLAANATTNTDTDNIDTSSTYAEKVAAAVADAAAFRNAAAPGESDTSVLVARAATADKAVTTAFASLSTAEKSAANTYTTAIAAEATAKAGIAKVTEKAGVVAAFDADTTADAALGAHSTATTAAALYAEYVNATADERIDIDAEFASSDTYAAFKAVAVKDAAYADAIKASLTAQDKLDSDVTLADTTADGFQVGTGNSTINDVEITFTSGNEATATGSTASNTYLNNLGLKTTADNLAKAATAADADVASAKALADAYAVVTGKTVDAAADVSGFSAAGVGVHATTVNATTGAIAFASTSADKDVFFFAPTEVAPGQFEKAPLVGASDATLTGFSTGDSIVLGSGYTFNSGALSTGVASALEVFFVKGANGTQVVIETNAVGSATTATNTAGTVTASNEAAVITLTGVTADHVSYANGVISYV